MPLYEYQCDACSHRFEQIRKFSDPPVDTCPSCGGAVTKLLSSPAIQFKGSGWYITDYARKSSSDASSGKNSDKSSDKTASDKSTSDSGSPASSTSTDSSSASSSTSTSSDTKK